MLGWRGPDEGAGAGPRRRSGGGASGASSALPRRPSIRGRSGASARRWKHPVTGCFGRSGVLQWVWGCSRRGNRQWLRSREPAIAAGPSLGGEGWAGWAWKDQQGWQRALEQRQQRIIRARPIIADDAGASWPARMREMCSMRRTLRTGLARCHGGDRHADGGPPQWGSVGLGTGTGSALGRQWVGSGPALDQNRAGAARSPSIPERGRLNLDSRLPRTGAWAPMPRR